MTDPSDDAFPNLPPPFGDMMRMMRQQAGDATGQAKAFAVNVASEGRPEGNVDPLTRMKVDQLARVAELRVADATGLDLDGGGQPSRVVAVTRSQWAATTIDHYQPYFDVLGQRLAEDDAEHDGPSDPDDLGPFAWLAPLIDAMAPMMLGITAGSMVGHLAVRGFGSYELPVPRPPGADVLVIVDNATTFARDWSLPEDDLVLWLCLHQLTHHAVLSVPHVRARLDQLLRDYLGAFSSGNTELGDHLGGMDLSDPASLQQQLGSPDVLLGMIETEAQRAILPQLHALVATIEGFVDVTMDRVGEQLIGSYRMATEALRRRRVEVDDASRFAERLFGFDLSQEQFDRGHAFATGVVERAGPEGLARLWTSERELPTVAEIDAPGLWLARIDLPVD